MIHKISEFLWERGRDLTKGKKGKDINVLPKEVGQKDTQKEEEWKDEIYNDMINIIYNNNIDKQHRLTAFNSRLDIRTTKYAAHIINSAFA